MEAAPGPYLTRQTRDVLLGACMAGQPHLSHLEVGAGWPLQGARSIQFHGFSGRSAVNAEAPATLEGHWYVLTHPEHQQGKGPGASAPLATEWNCPKCTSINAADRTTCFMCGAKQEAKAKEAVVEHHLGWGKVALARCAEGPYFHGIWSKGSEFGVWLGAVNHGTNGFASTFKALTAEQMAPSAFAVGGETAAVLRAENT